MIIEGSYSGSEDSLTSHREKERTTRLKSNGINLYCVAREGTGSREDAGPKRQELLLQKNLGAHVSQMDKDR